MKKLNSISSCFTFPPCSDCPLSSTEHLYKTSFRSTDAQSSASVFPFPLKSRHRLFSSTDPSQRMLQGIYPVDQAYSPQWFSAFQITVTLKKVKRKALKSGAQLIVARPKVVTCKFPAKFGPLLFLSAIWRRSLITGIYNDGSVSSSVAVATAATNDHSHKQNPPYKRPVYVSAALIHTQP